ncbi:hypothetical protein VNO77_25104 [Canavalia gladiata]|uniref:Uncharacterized protein n=1 Tax=Canavalia gladiata TaxID=3824 RepID=A0AAN9LAY2_CANGL
MEKVGTVIHIRTQPTSKPLRMIIQSSHFCRIVGLPDTRFKLASNKNDGLAEAIHEIGEGDVEKGEFEPLVNSSTVWDKLGWRRCKTECPK